MTDLILASGSPYRSDMLARLELPFEVKPAEIDETAHPGESGTELAARLGLEKAAHVAHGWPDAIVIGSDQVAVCRGRLLGKPGSVERAVEQLAFCSGHEVVFHSSVAVVQGNRVIGQDQVPTRVRLRALSEDMIRAYVERERPLDCAGAMKSEALGIALAEAITSDDPTALIGLPLIATVTLLEAAGLDIIRGVRPHPGRRRW